MRCLKTMWSCWDAWSAPPWKPAGCRPRRLRKSTSKEPRRRWRCAIWLKEAQADQILLRNGAMSPQTMAARHGLDPEIEQRRMAES